MSAGNMAAWRKQNSAPVAAELQLVDGTRLNGTLLIQRDQSIKDLLCGPDAFVEFECNIGGEMIIGKVTIATVRPRKQALADQLERKLKLLEKSDAFTVLKIAKSASRDKVRDAYLTLTGIYHPDRYAAAQLPAEVLEYFNTMTRNINSAYTELNQLMAPAVANDADAA